MNDQELMRLYLLYKAGSVQDGNKNSDLLQVAKATASDLTEEEFAWLNREIRSLQSSQYSLGQDQRDTAGVSKDSKGGWNIWQTAKSFAMGSSDYQKRLWELPDLVRSDKPFTPTRLADGNPIDLDPNDPEGSQERLKSQPYSQVKHDPKLRDAWHAAQSGKLADMLKGGDVWQAYTDPQLLQDGVEAAKPVRSNLSAPLRSLLASMDRGELDQRQQSSAESIGKNLDSYQVYKDDPEQWIKRLTGDDRSYHAEHLYRNAVDDVPASVKLRDVVVSGNEDDARQWVHDVRAYHEKTVRQKLVDYQIAGYRPSVAQQAAEASSASESSVPVSAPPIQDAENANAPPVQIDLGKTARQNAASDAQGIVEDPMDIPGSGKGTGGWLDMLQTGLDAGGVVDPSPITDGINAGVSIVRAFTDPQNAGKHIVNAGVSAVSMLPYLGDLAKVFKYGGKAGKVAGEAGKVSGEAGGFGGMIGKVLGGLGGGGSGGGLPPSDGATSNDGEGINWKFLGGLTLVATGLAASFKALGAWVDRTVESGKALIESQRDLSKYSGELTNAFAKYDTSKVFRDVRSAEYLDSSAAGLAGAQADLEDARAFRDLPQKRFNNDFGNAKAQVATGFTYIQSMLDVKGQVLRAIYTVVDAVKESKDADPRSGLEALFQKMDRDKAAEEAKKNPPKEIPRLPADAAPKGLQDRINRLNIR